MHRIWGYLVRVFSRLGVFLMGRYYKICLLVNFSKRGGDLMATTPVSINDATALGSALAADKIPVSRSGNLTPTTVTAANIAALATKSTVGLGNCDNTSDANKPISSATQVALGTKADREDTATIGNFNHLLTVADGDTFNVKDSLGVAQFTVTGTGTAGLRDKLTVGSLAIASTDVTATASEINTLASSGITNADLVKVHAVTATAAEINKLTGTPAGLTATEIGYLDGVTSALKGSIINSTFAESWVTHDGDTVTLRVYNPALGGLYGVVALDAGNVNLTAIGGTVKISGVAEFNNYIKAVSFRVASLNTAPANAGATGTTGEIRFCADAIYVCTATNTWKKVDIATW